MNPNEINWTEYNGFFIFFDPNRQSIDDCGIPYPDPIHVVTSAGKSVFTEVEIDSTASAMALIDAEIDGATREFFGSVPKHTCEVIPFRRRGR